MYHLVILPHFKRQAKPYTKKYRHLKEALVDTLENFRPNQHTALGNGVFKVRLQSKDIAKGKSKSFRLIVYVVEVDKLLVPITIYFKGDQSTISKKELNDHLEIILFEQQTEQLFNK